MMIVLLVLALTLAALPAHGLGVGRAAQPVRAVAAPALRQYEPIAPAALRPGPRVAVHTSAALLAIALALDVSAAPPVLAARAADGVQVAELQQAYVLPDAEAQAWTAVELAPDWSYKAVSATEGW